MPGAGGTTDLYKENADGSRQPLGTPPAAPTDVPAPTKVEVAKPVITQKRMADETPDGHIRDTSSEALRPGNDLNFRNLSDEEIKKPEEVPAAPAEVKPAEPVKEAAPVPEKLYAGKFKTAEDLEKGYEEAQKAMHAASEKAARLEREKNATPAPPPAPKTPEQVASEQAENNRLLQELTSDPKTFIEKNIVQRTMVALSAQQVAENWRKANPDLAEHEIRVAFEATLLAQSDPELAANHVALLQKATDNFRQFTGKIRTEGAKEALTQETRVIPLLQPSSTTTAAEQPSQKAPLTPDTAFDMHMRFLKEQEQKSHRGLRR